eukprot:2021551-Rhodomonas_salina.2
MREPELRTSPKELKGWTFQLPVTVSCKTWNWSVSARISGSARLSGRNYLNWATHTLVRDSEGLYYRRIAALPSGSRRVHPLSPHRGPPPAPAPRPTMLRRSVFLLNSGPASPTARPSPLRVMSET